MAYKFAVANIPYNISDVRLGSLVPNRKRPNQDAFWPASLAPLREGQDYTWRNVENFEFTGHAWQEGSAGARLASLLTFSGSSKKSRDKSLHSHEGRIYELKQPKTLFSHILASDGTDSSNVVDPAKKTVLASSSETTDAAEPARGATDPAKDTEQATEPTKGVQSIQKQGQVASALSVKTWLLQQHDEGEDVYFIVGYRTFFNVAETDEASAISAVKGRVAVPIPEPSTATTNAPAKPVEIEGHRDAGREQKQSFVVPGERIYAVYYRRVVFSWFSGDDAADKVKLGRRETQWVVASAQKRGQPSTPMAVSVELADMDLVGDPLRVETGDLIEEYYVDPGSDADEDAESDIGADD